MKPTLTSRIRAGAIAAAALTAALAARPQPAHACGGLFCSAANPVNQAAEQILFVENGDGTVTAVIQILYEGPANKFAWVLPMPGNPKVGVSSNSALDMLKQRTNPTYRLTTVSEGNCPSFGNAASSGAGGFSAATPMQMPPIVNQIAAGSVGPYDYTVIEVVDGTESPETAAIDWLTENGFDVGALGPEVLRPYLEEGLNLIAFKLQKGTDTGSIRPVVLTYDGTRPSIPIRPTAVAANDDMGVLVWTLGGARGIPANYKALELNEALIDWFNPNRNYNEVVSQAADEAMGQGFVTEFAGTVQSLGGLDLFPDWQQQQWTEFTTKEYADALSMLEASLPWSAWDGYDDARRRAVTLPETISYEDFLRCTPCYINDPAVVFDRQRFLRELYELVIKPVIETDDLVQSRPYLTRLYTTLSADEMTMDPLFEFNGDLPDVSNVHVATRYFRCDSTNNWRVELPSAGTVQGSVVGTWPVAMDSQPAAQKIMEFGTSGMGRVLEDRTSEILAVNKAPAVPPATAGTGSIRPAAGAGGRSSQGGKGGSNAAPDAGPAPPVDGDPVSAREKSGCAVAASGGDSLAWLLLACAALLRRRRRSA